MKPDPAFLKRSKSFWAHVRSISQQTGYAVRGQDEVKVPTGLEMHQALNELGLDGERVADGTGGLTVFGKELWDYFAHRANVLNGEVRHNLMDAVEAAALFERLRAEGEARCPLPMNKQKGEKAKHAYLTCIVNMIVERNTREHGCDYNPQSLTTVTVNGAPLRTLARRVDGAFPTSVNPVAIWEVKEYYYTTTFGSRIADGIYETLLDGMEIEELQQSEGIEIKHYLFIDARETWWLKGKSYLCRIVDMLHMGYLDEVLVGREVETALPAIAQSWSKSVKRQ